MADVGDDEELDVSTDSDVAARSVGVWLFCFAVLSSAFLEGLVVQAGPLSLDEHGSYWAIDSVAPSTTFRRSLDQTALPPLSYWLQEAAVSLFGRSEFVLRLPSVFLATLSVVLVGVASRSIARDMVGESHAWIAGGVASMLLAWHPNILLQTRFGRCYGLVLLLSVVVTWATVSWSRRLTCPRAALLWCLAAAMLFWTHYAAALFLALCGLAATIKGLACLPRAEAARGLIVSLFTAVGLVAAAIPLLPALFRIQAFAEVLGNRENAYSVVDMLGPLVLVGGPLGWALSFTNACGRSTDRRLLDWWAIGLLSVVSIVPLVLVGIWSQVGAGAIGSPRYRLPYQCVAIILVSLGWSRCRWGAATAGCVLTAAAMVYAAPSYPWSLGRLGGDADHDWKQLTLTLGERVGPNDTILVQGGLAESSLLPLFYADPLMSEYVACRVSRFYLPTNHRRLGIPFHWDADNEMVDWYAAQLAALRDQGQTGWLVGAKDTDLNRVSTKGLIHLAQQVGLEATVIEDRATATLIQLSPNRADGGER